MELASNYQERWNQFNLHFTEILGNYLPKQNQLLHSMEGHLEIMPNILIYGIYGFPLDMLWKEALLRRFSIPQFVPTSCIWGKDIPYMETPYYIHVDMEHPSMSKDIELLQEFLKTIVTTRNILSERHIIILENIDSIVNRNSNMNAFRVLLERFSKNVWFICTTYHISKIEPPLKSRFDCIRVPLPTENEILQIIHFIDDKNENTENTERNNNLKNMNNTETIPYTTRNILLAFTVPTYEDDTMYWVSSLCFPPIYDYMLHTPVPTIENIRAVIYKAFQCGISISELAKDIIEICIQREDKEQDIHQMVAEFSKYEYMASQSKGTRLLLYMEYMLHYVMIILPAKKEKSKLSK